MEATLYANLNRQTLAEKSDGGTYAWPPLVAGDTLDLRLRFTKRIEGRNLLVPLQVADLYAGLAVVDQRPLSGSYRLKIGPLAEPGVEGENLTTPLLAGAAAAQWQTALNALALCGADGGYGPATVTADNGSHIVVFRNLAAAGTVVLADNELSPSTLLRVIPVDRDGTVEHDCRLIQAPAAMTSAFSLEAAAAPRMERHRAGSDEDGAKINEIQILTIPPEFAGAAEFERDGRRSKPFGRTYDEDQIQEVLAPLADEGGRFSVTNVLPNEAWIEFQGSMEATPQELLGVHVVRAPQGDVAFSLDLNQPAVFALLRAADNVEAWLHFVAIYEDADTGKLRRWSYLQKVRIARPVVWNGLDVDEAIDFLRKPGDVYPPAADGQIVTGSQHYSRAFPTSLELGATAFVHTHNLGESFGHVVLATNSLPGVRLVEGTDYAVTALNDDQFSLQLLAGGYFSEPIVEIDGGVWKFVRTAGGSVAAENHLAVAFSSIGPRSAFAAHGHVEEDIPTVPPKFADIFSRLAALELLAPGQLAARTTAAGGDVRKPLPHFAYIYPQIGRGGIALPGPGERLATLDAATFPRVAPRLAGAVHDAAVSALPTLLDGGIRIPVDPTPAHIGQVYENQTAGPVDLAIGTGWELAPGDFAVTDGEDWYPAARYGDGESSYYPAHLERTLWEDMVQPGELPPGSEMEVRFPVELAMLMANTPMHCQIVVETARLTADTAPGTPGPNLATRIWAEPHLAQDLVVTAVPREFVFGYRVRRAKNGDLSAEKLAFGRWTTTTAPLDAAFSIRGRLIRWDTPNTVAEPAGLVAATGGVPFADGTSPDGSDAVGQLAVRY